MKKTSKRILLSIITLVLIVVALGTTTFAWFTLSNTSNVSNIEATVQAGEGLEIGYSLSDTATEPTSGFKTNLTKADWTDIMSEINDEITDDTFKFGAVTSTAINSQFTTLIPGVELVGGFTNLTSQNVSKNTVNSYLEFTIHFKSYTASDVKWTNYTFNDIDSGDHVTFTPGVIFDGMTGDTKDTPVIIKDASNAIRIQVGNTVVQKANEVDGNVANDSVQLSGQYSYLMKKNYRIDGMTADEPTGTMITAVQSLGTGVNIITLVDDTDKGYAKAKATVRIWIEGWDADAYDAILKTKLSFNLEFTKGS